MTLKEIKKDFTNLAVRLDRKSYLDATYRKLLLDGVCSMDDGGRSLSYYYYENLQRTKELWQREVADIYEVKSLFKKMLTFCTENRYTRLRLVFVDGEFRCEAHKEMEVELREDEE